MDNVEVKSLWENIKSIPPPPRIWDASVLIKFVINFI